MTKELKNSVSEVVRSELKDREDAVTENPSTSAFVNSEPIREEQVQNAVKFLSHPNVRGSPVIHRRSFLERKGLTKEEIDEAFRLVPDSPSAVLTTQTAATANLDTQLKSTLTSQSKGANASPAPFRFYWSQALLAVGILAISGAGTIVILKNAIVPRLKSWIRKVVLEEEVSVMKSRLKPSLAEETAAAAKAAAIAAADVARASQEILISKTEERRYFGELVNLVKIQVQEMKAMSFSIRKLEGTYESSRTSIRKLEGQNTIPDQDNRVSTLTSRSAYTNGVAEFGLKSARPLSPPASVEPSVAPHPKSYMEIMAMIQRGEKPPNIREINDLPPNPNQPVSKPRLTPRPKPWEVAQSQNGSTPFLRSQENGNGFVSSIEDKGHANKLKGDITVPQWQQKQNVRITEIESEDDTSMAKERAVVQRAWVPPQPPPVVMPEAAAAIRQPKKSSIQNERAAEDQLLSRESVIIDDLQRITKESESGGGAGEGNGESSVVVDTSSGEMQKENQLYP